MDFPVCDGAHSVAQIVHDFLQLGDGLSDLGRRLSGSAQMALRIIECLVMQCDAVAPQLFGQTGLV